MITIMWLRDTDLLIMEYWSRYHVNSIPWGIRLGWANKFPVHTQANELRGPLLEMGAATEVIRCTRLKIFCKVIENSVSPCVRLNTAAHDAPPDSNSHVICVGLYVCVAGFSCTPPRTAGFLVRHGRFDAQLHSTLQLYSKLGFFENRLSDFLNNRKPNIWLVLLISLCINTTWARERQ